MIIGQSPEGYAGDVVFIVSEQFEEPFVGVGLLSSHFGGVNTLYVVVAEVNRNIELGNLDFDAERFVQIKSCRDVAA